MDERIDESDAESFHSAISTVTKESSRYRSMTTADVNSTITTSLIKHNNIPSGRPRSGTTCSSTSKPSPKPPSKPRSKSLRQDPITVPHRRSSLPKQKQKQRPRKDSATLHLQSYHLFSSLDGMLAMSRDITPLPSVSSSRTTTRHASLVPDDIDQRLIAATPQNQYNEYPFTHGNPYATNSPDTSPTLPSGFDPQISERSSLITRSITTDTSRAQQRPQLNTVISWTSNATRRAEYEKIDRAHSGVRGFVRRVWPQCLRKKDGRRPFFTGDSDEDSVRRFRMDVSDEDSDAELEIREIASGDEFDEKFALKIEDACTADIGEKGNETAKRKKTTTKKPLWSCFDS
ncbi:hypothetical protein H2200_001340 [Cladophialophora chaetospira]|uniref:Uncharacterized protein n=1 Tax=Cladophialophora chaetospira TaxID=386627 RepID=A0AA39CPI3_9EURO|nr:hypothetical protein H2200_001340 [Cladophialophora chaetospira]